MVDSNITFSVSWLIAPMMHRILTVLSMLQGLFLIFVSSFHQKVSMTYLMWTSRQCGACSGLPQLRILKQKCIVNNFVHEYYQNLGTQILLLFTIQYIIFKGQNFHGCIVSIVFAEKFHSCDCHLYKIVLLYRRFAEKHSWISRKLQKP